MVEVATAFGELLRGYRANTGLTQEALAERAGLSVRGISDLERGVKQRPYPHTVQRLIKALGLTEEEAARFQRASLHRAEREESPESDAPARIVQGALLPLQPTSFIGRQQEVEEIKAILGREEVRLLTLTGPGGVGKTRLALRVAEDAPPRFSDGVVFVSLASLSDPDLVPATIARSVGVRQGSGQPVMDALLHHLFPKRNLLVVDNFEHVLPAVRIVSQLLAACPSLSILVTSRAVLQLAAEWAYPVAPLATPIPGHVPGPEGLSRYDAVQLFVQRARAVKSGFALSEENAGAIAEICSRLDGLPLAIELAAARLRLFSPSALLERLSDRRELLAGGPRDVPARLQTLRNTIDWSYVQLSPEERRLFARLSVFAGGSTLEDAEAVCDLEGDLDVLAALGSLVEKSLLQQDGEHSRFAMLETIREYAAEKLNERGEASSVRDRHLAVFLDLAERADKQIHGPADATWFQRLEMEQDNIRAVMDWSEESGKVEAGVQLAGALFWFWYARGHWAEGQQRLARLLVLPSVNERTVARARAFFAAGLLTSSLGDLDSADAYLRRAVTLGEGLGRDGARVQSLACAYLAFCQANLRGLELNALAEQSLRLAEESGDRWTAAMARLAAGVVSHIGGDLDAARRYHEEGLVIVRELGESYSAGPQLFWLANVCRTQGDLQTARARMEEAIIALRAVEATPLLADVLVALGSILLDQGTIEEAIALEEEALSLAQDCGSWIPTFNAMRNLAEADALRGNYAHAVAGYDEVLATARSVGEPALIAMTLGLRARVTVRQGDLAQARGQCEEGLGIARSAGVMLPILLQTLGWVARDEGEYEEAALRFRAALTAAHQQGDVKDQVSLIQDFAILSVRIGTADRAAHLLQAEAALREKMGLVLDEVRRTELQEAAEEARAALGELDWHRALEEGREMSLEQAVAYALSEGG